MVGFTNESFQCMRVWDKNMCRFCYMLKFVEKVDFSDIVEPFLSGQKSRLQNASQQLAGRILILVDTNTIISNFLQKNKRNFFQIEKPWRRGPVPLTH